MSESKVMIIAGEASGDFHGANLVRELKRLRPGMTAFGIGGPRMRAEGVDTRVDAREMAVVGLFEVLRHFPTIYGALRRMRRLLREERPDLLVLVDYPDFNLRLAKSAKALGIPVLFYISPQIWAWRQHRVHEIGRRIDMMAVVFPFEAPFYERAGVPVRFVGHPLVDELRCDLSHEEADHLLGLHPAHPTVGLFPGSRRSEIKRLLPTLLASAERLAAERPDTQFVLPLASSLEPADIEPYLAASTAQVSVVEGRPYEVMRACDAIVSASGTATLEIALVGTPLLVVYKVAPLTYQIMRRLIRVPYIGLCNIVAGEKMATELVQDAAEPRAIAAELQRLLEPQVAEAVRRKLSNVRERLGEPGGAGRVAALADEMLGCPPPPQRPTDRSDAL